MWKMRDENWNKMGGWEIRDTEICARCTHFLRSGTDQPCQQGKKKGLTMKEKDKQKKRIRDQKYAGKKRSKSFLFFAL